MPQRPQTQPFEIGVQPRDLRRQVVLDLAPGGAAPASTNKASTAAAHRHRLER